MSTGKAESTVLVPDQKGKTRDAAEAALKEAGFEPLVVEDYDLTVAAGTVFSQLPAVGEKRPAGSTVVIGVAKAAS